MSQPSKYFQTVKYRSPIHPYVLALHRSSETEHPLATTKTSPWQAEALRQRCALYIQPSTVKQFPP